MPRDRLVAHAREVVLLPRVERHRGRAVTRGRGRRLEDDWRPELRVPDISKCMNNVSPPLRSLDPYAGSSYMRER